MFLVVWLISEKKHNSLLNYQQPFLPLGLYKFLLSTSKANNLNHTDTERQLHLKKMFAQIHTRIAYHNSNE